MMVILAKRGHPRKRDWWHYQCNECNDMFWGPPLEATLGQMPKEHYCASCAADPPQSSHFTSARHDTAWHVDSNYHGGRWNQGEW